MAAPSAENAQEWEFIVIDRKDIFEEIMKVHEYSFALKSAPVAILICADPSRQAASEGDWWIQDCSAATENMLIEATHLGLGSIWLGMYPYKHRTEPVSQLLQIPKHIIPFSLVAIGYPAREKEPVDRYNPEIISFNVYGNISPARKNKEK